MLKTLIATLTNDLSRPKYNRGCQTKIDPVDIQKPASERLTGLDWRAEDTLPAHRDRLSLPNPEQLA